MRVCPECGNDSFTATLTTRTEYTYKVYDEGSLFQAAEEVVDWGDEGDIDTLDCTDCGESHDPDALVTPEDYVTDPESYA